MIKAAICEDERDSRDYLSALIRRQPYLCEIAEYPSAAAYLAGGREADLLFLDIGLGKGKDGLELARELRARPAKSQPLIVFITGYERYVFDAFDVEAFQYLLKPVDEEKFAAVFARAAARIGKCEEKQPPAGLLTLRLGGSSHTLLTRSIYYIESSSHQVILHTDSGEFSCYARMADLEAELQGDFYRIHKGYLVNLRYVRAYTKTELTLENREKLLISKYKYPGFARAHLQFMKRGLIDG
ncbi:MAG: response regulator transcription factor [Provencibacterium sp.]|nr:response regulator transcription factor [Provencibacterium sp.]